MIHRSVVLLLLYITLSIAVPEINNGTINLSSSRLDDALIPLAGETNIFWEQFLSYEDLQNAPEPTASFQIPGNWNSIKTENGLLPRKGFATITVDVVPPTTEVDLALKLPPIRTAYRLYYNDSLITSVGTPATNADSAIPDYSSFVISLPRTTEPFTLIFHISNFDNSKGGPWLTAFIGDTDTIYRLRNRALGYDVFFVGALFFFAIIQLISFAADTGSRMNEIPYLILFSLSMMLHIGLTGECLFYFLFQEIPPQIMVGIDYLSFFGAGVFFHLYLHNKFKRVSNVMIAKLVLVVGGFFSILVVTTPLYIHSQLIPAYQIFIFIIIFYQVILTYRARKSYGDTSLIYLILIMLMFIATLHDIAGTYAKSSPVKLTPLISLIVVFTQTFLLIQGYGNITTERRRISNTLDTINNVVCKFVPTQIFELLNTTVEEITPGIQEEFTLTVMTADIRGFTALSERMSPEMNFSFINQFNAIIIPIIEKHNGFINNFVGDQFTAIFPDKTDDAVNASIEIQTELTASEHFSSYMIKQSLYLGIGIDHGPVIIGIHGSEDRMENILMGDAVLGAGRLETLTKATGTKIIISQNVLENCSTGLESDGRNLGYDYEKLRNLQMFELFHDSNDPDTKRKKRSRDTMEQAVFYLQENQYRRALSLLDELPEEFTRHDSAITYLRKQCLDGLT